MRGVLILGDEQVIVREFPDPVPGPGQVVVRVKAAAVCGSDLHNWYWRSRDELARSGQDAVIPGHEPSGIVEAVGPDVQGVKAGDRVVVWCHCSGACGRCMHCMSGEEWFCRGASGEPRRRPSHGADAELLLAQDWQCVPLPQPLSFEAGAVLACAGGTAYQVARRLDVTCGQTVAILGAGPIGLATLLVCRALGARTIVAEPVPERLEHARMLGADAVVDSVREGVSDAIAELTEGAGVEAVVETSGNPAAQREAVEIVRPGGRIGLVGFGPGGRRREGTISPDLVIWKQLTLIGSFVYPPSLFAEVASFALERALPLEDLVTHRVPLAEAAEAFRLFDTRRTGKIVLVP